MSVIARPDSLTREQKPNIRTKRKKVKLIPSISLKQGKPILRLRLKRQGENIIDISQKLGK